MKIGVFSSEKKTDGDIIEFWMTRSRKDLIWKDGLDGFNRYIRKEQLSKIGGNIILWEIGYDGRTDVQYENLTEMQLVLKVKISFFDRRMRSSTKQQLWEVSFISQNISVLPCKLNIIENCWWEGLCRQ